MPRDLFRLLFTERVRALERDFEGQTIGNVYTTPFDTAGTEMTVVDLLVNMPDGVIQLSAIPVAANNQEMRHAAMGSPVRIRRSNSGRVEVVGLSKRGVGEVRNFALNLGLGSTSAGHLSLVTPKNITLGGLDSATSEGSGGFGYVPFQAIGLFDANDNFVKIGWP